MTGISRHVFVAIALSALASGVAAAPEDGAALLARAAKKLDLRAEGSPPFRLRARVATLDDQGKRLEGNYHLLWLSPTTWREEIAFLAFKEVTGRSGTRAWRVRTLDVTPEPVRGLRYAMRFGERLARRPAWKIEPLQRKSVRGVEQSCVKVHPNERSSRSFCFDAASGDLIREIAEDGDDTGVVIDYGGRLESGSKWCPASIRYEAADRLRIQLDVGEFEKAEDVDATWFLPPEGAEEEPACEVLEPPEALPGAGDAPASGGGSSPRGTAALEFRVAVDGSVRRVRLVSASSPEFGRAAAVQVSKMKFKPARCDGRPVELDYFIRKSAR